MIKKEQNRSKSATTAGQEKRGFSGFPTMPEKDIEKSHNSNSSSQGKQHPAKKPQTNKQKGISI